MRPGARRADAQDLFLSGREATVQSVLYDLDGNMHIAVTPDRDEAADLQRSRGRYLYFSAEELEPHPGRRSRRPRGPSARAIGHGYDAGMRAAGSAARHRGLGGTCRWR